MWAKCKNICLEPHSLQYGFRGINLCHNAIFQWDYIENTFDNCFVFVLIVVFAYLFVVLSLFVQFGISFSLFLFPLMVPISTSSRFKIEEF